MKKTFPAILLIAIMILSVSAAFASGSGLFGEMAQSEYADERMAVLDEVAEKLSASVITGVGIPVEISQGYYEGNRVFISYRIGANTDLIELYAGIPDEGIVWDQIEENWILGEIPAGYPDVKKENDWLDGRSQRWLTSPYCNVMDGIDLEDGTYADIIAGYEDRQADGSIIGWKECVIPEGKNDDTLTFKLSVSCATAIKFQDYSTFKENFGQSEESTISFTLSRSDSFRYLHGISYAEACQARVDLAMGKIDLKGTVRLVSAEQAASWIAWQEGEEETDTDVIVCWNLYRNGELVSVDLYGATSVNGTDEIIFEVMFPCLDDLSGLTLVPEYSQVGEKSEEAIVLELSD